MKGDLVLSRNQVRRIDELAQTQYGLPGIVLMENAGAAAARIIDRHYGPGGSALIACGTGNNGGDGLVIARHLHNLGWTVRVVIAGDPAKMSPDCAANDGIIQSMKVERSLADIVGDLQSRLKEIRPDVIVVDALLGTGSTGLVRPTLATLIDRLNTMPKRAMVAVDVPSGLDCDTGLPGGTAIRADLTITFVALKPGFLTESGRRYVGEYHVVGIGVPQELIERVANTEDPCEIPS